MSNRRRLFGAATSWLVVAAVACVPAAQQDRQKPAEKPAEKTAEKTAEPSKPAEPVFEVLVQYRDGTRDADKAAVRKSIGGKLKENLDSPSGASGLEVLLVPRTKKHETMEQVVSELRRNKAVRIAEPQQVYRKQSGGA